jgi:hypothetical protein
VAGSDAHEGVILVEWSEFAVRFARELAGLDRDTILIVREHDESRHYVQAMREPERLYAEAVSNNFLDGPLALTPADEEVLAEAGWRPPTADWSPANWWTELAHDPPPGAHAELADMMVTALRDVQGVRRPADLVYESFHRDGYGLIELADFGIPAADPTRIIERRGGTDGDTAHQAHRERIIAAPTPPPFPERPRSPEAAPPSDLPPAEIPPAEIPAAGPTADAELPPVPDVPPPYQPSDAETRLVEALRCGDAAACYDQFLAAELVLPATGQAVEDPSLTEFTTVVVDGETRVPAFTSAAAMARAMGERAGLHRRTTFPELAAAWPDPSWSLVINGGLPSEVRVDAVTVARLDEMRRTAQQASTVDALVGRPAPAPVGTSLTATQATATRVTAIRAAAIQPAAAPAAAIRPSPARPAIAAARRPLPVPHGAQLWRLTDATPDAVPVAKYDAAADRWIAAESLPQLSG